MTRQVGLLSYCSIILSCSEWFWLLIVVILSTIGNVYIADYYNNRIRMVTVSTGIISTIAGTGGTSYNGDGMAATSATLYYPQGVALDSSKGRVTTL